MSHNNLPTPAAVAAAEDTHQHGRRGSRPGSVTVAELVALHPGFRADLPTGRHHQSGPGMFARGATPGGTR